MLCLEMLQQPPAAPRHPVTDPLNAMADEDMDFEGFNFFEPKSVLEAAARGDLDTVQSGLLQFGEFVLLEGDGGAGLTVLHLAAQNGHENIIDFVMKNHPGLDVDLAALDGTTPLMLAVMHEKANIVRQLLRFGAGKRGGDSLIETALMTENETIISLLLDIQQTQPQQKNASQTKSVDPIVPKPAPISLNNNAVSVRQTTVTTSTTQIEKTTISSPVTSADEELVRLLRKIEDLEAKIQYLEEKDQCVICMERQIGTVILDCGHLCLCLPCAQKEKLPTCPVCQERVSKIVKTYRA